MLNGENIKEYLSNNQTFLKENYNQTLIKKLETLAEKEKEQYNSLMKPFIEEGIIEQNFSFTEKFKLGWYRFFSNYEKLEELYNTLCGRETLNSLKQTKEGLKQELERARNLKKNYEDELTTDKQKVKHMIQILERTQKDIELTNNSLVKLEIKKDELEDILEKEDNYTINISKNDEFEKLSGDIERIQEESIDALETADIDKLKVIDLKINVHEKTQLRTFYKDMAKSYVRHIDILSNLIIKLNKGMSYSKAHELIKRFVQYDTPISKYMNIKKTELEKYNKEVLRINPPYVREKLTNINTKRDSLDYKLRMEEGAAELKEFLRDFRRH